MIAYKVLKRTERGLISCGDIPDVIKFKYKQKTINKPKIKNSKFFIFEYIGNAKKFKSDCFLNCKSDLEIWEVEVPDLERVGLLLPLWSHRELGLEDVESYWIKGSDIEAQTTMGCCETSSIKLIKRSKFRLTRSKFSARFAL